MEDAKSNEIHQNSVCRASHFQRQTGYVALRTSLALLAVAETADAAVKETVSGSTKSLKRKQSFF